MMIPNLRSPHDTVGGMVYFGRMLDKIRLHTDLLLPPEYIKNLGGGFDLRMLDFLQVSYSDVVRETLSNKTDEEVLEWCLTHGLRPSEEQIEVWNGFMTKRGWKDAGTEILNFRLKEGGFEERTDIQTMFDYIDLDEGRDPAKK